LKESGIAAQNDTKKPLSFEEAHQVVRGLQNRIKESIFGQEDLIHEVMCCFLAGGHILITGAPGLAKTSLVRVIGSHLGLTFGRIQFTPDLLPSDIIGSEVLEVDAKSGERSFRFIKGPVFNNLILADEINRASPRTQSALLEAMQERTCTVAGVSHELQHPFMVFATQNPFESEGTFPLPEAQLDRFLIQSLVDYPSPDAEEKVLTQHAAGKLFGEQKSVRASSLPETSDITLQTIEQIIEKCGKVSIENELVRVIMDLVRSSRPGDEACLSELRDAIWFGAGPRAGISLISVSKACALLDNSDTVRWKHVRRMAIPVLRHRIRLSAKGRIKALSEDAIITQLLTQLEQKYAFLAKGLF
jgi:MoxR-like ATPase